ncbi:MAG: type II toxin-antitoxin system HicA family toxin [Thermoguttaceae bacterium]
MARNLGDGAVKYREVARKLSALGCHELARRDGGSHRKWLNPDTQSAAVFPDWGGRDLKLGTIRSAVRQLGIDWQVFHGA